MDVAGEHLVAQRKAVEAHLQRDQELLAVGPVIAGIAALRERVPFGLDFEICARHVIKQHLVVDREQLPCAMRQVRFERRLVGEQPI